MKDKKEDDDENPTLEKYEEFAKKYLRPATSKLPDELIDTESGKTMEFNRVVRLLTTKKCEDFNEEKDGSLTACEELTNFGITVPRSSNLTGDHSSKNNYFVLGKTPLCSKHLKEEIERQKEWDSYMKELEAKGAFRQKLIICRKCGKAQKRKDTHCWNCGTPLDK